jgi:chromosomal replication initiator protein
MVSFPFEGFDVSRKSSRLLKEAIASRIPSQQFETWFRDLPIRLVAPNRVLFLVPNRFSKNWIERKYNGVIAESVHSIFGFDPVTEVLVETDEGVHNKEESGEKYSETPVIEHIPSVCLETLSEAAPDLSGLVPDTEISKAIQSAVPAARLEADFLPSLPINRDFTFQNFVIGPSNRLTHAAALGVTENPGRSYNPFFIYGGVGLGKTHLLHAISQRLRDADRLSVTYLTTEAFVNLFSQAWERGSLESFRRRIRSTDVLIVDDIQFISRQERTQEEFFHTFNALVSESKQVVLSSDCPPREIPGLKDRLVSRFKMGLVTRIDLPDFSTRVAIIHKKAKARGKDIPDSVAEYISNNLATNIREIEGAITRLFSMANMQRNADDPLGPPITIDLARTALEEIAHEDGPRGAVAISDIQKAASLFYDVKIAEINSKKRNRTISLARQVCMFLARKLTPCSLEEIGAYLGGRDHATVLYSINRILELSKKDSRLEADLKTLTHRIMASRF